MSDETRLPERGAGPSTPDPRVVMAAERTLLAWIRTGLALMGFGFVVARFGFFLREIASVRGLPPIKHAGLSQWAGTGLVVLAVLMIVLAGARHVRFIYLYNRNQLPRPGMVSLGTVLSAFLALVGIAVAVYLVLLR